MLKYETDLDEWRLSAPMRFAELVSVWMPDDYKTSWFIFISSVTPPTRPTMPYHISDDAKAAIMKGACTQVELIRARIELMAPNKAGAIALDSYDQVFNYISCR